MLRQFVHQTCRNLNFVGKRSVCTTKNLQYAEKEPEKPAPKVTILVEKDENITLIGINRPKHRNAIDSSTARQMCDAFTKFEEDATSPVAVLYGVGGSFCAGYDILEMGKGDQVGIEILLTHEGSVGPTRRNIKKPVVCGINGYCIANGLELALMCDLRVMEETAVMGFFNRRFGVPVIDGGTSRLPAMIGFSRAVDLILTGRPVSAAEAHNMGIINRIVPTGTALCKAIELAKQLAKFPQGALLHDRHSLWSSTFENSSFNQAVQNEVMYTSKEIIDQMQEGITWFNKTFKPDTTHTWLQRERSMADWDDKDIADAAAKIEVEKQQKKAECIEAKKKVEDDQTKDK